MTLIITYHNNILHWQHARERTHAIDIYQLPMQDITVRHRLLYKYESTMSDSDFLVVPNDPIARHEHALRVLNLRMTSKDTETKLSKPEATSKKSVCDTSKYIDFTTTNKYYGKLFDPIRGKDEAKPLHEHTSASASSDEQKEAMTFEPVTLRFNPESLLKMSNEMVNAKVSGVNQNCNNGSDDNITKHSSTDLHQAQRGNSILDGFGQTYRIMYQNNDPAAPNSNGETYTYPRIPRSSIMKSPDSGKVKATTRLNNSKQSSTTTRASVGEQKRQAGATARSEGGKRKITRNQRGKKQAKTRP